MGSRGMVRDEETGNSYAWFRYTINGHWLSEDPIGFSAGDANLMRVTSNSPIMLSDPTGLVAYAADGTIAVDQAFANNQESTFWQDVGNIAGNVAVAVLHPVAFIAGFRFSDIGLAIQHPIAYPGGALLGAFHGQTMVWNAATWHLIPPLKNYVNTTIEQNGGVYGTANVWAHVGAIAGELAIGFSFLPPIVLWPSAATGTAAAPTASPIIPVALTMLYQMKVDMLNHLNSLPVGSPAWHSTFNALQELIKRIDNFKY